MAVRLKASFLSHLLVMEGNKVMQRPGHSTVDTQPCVKSHEVACACSGERLEQCRIASLFFFMHTAVQINSSVSLT